MPIEKKICQIQKNYINFAEIIFRESHVRDRKYSRPTIQGEEK
jgi:hypothetical protein